MIATDNGQLACDLIQSVTTTTVKEALFLEADAFKCRNFGRWLSYLVDLGVVSPKATVDLFANLLAQYKANAQVLQADLILHTFLVFLTTEATAQKMKTATDFEKLMGEVSALMTAREKREDAMREIRGLAQEDSLRATWRLYQASPEASFAANDVLLSINAEALA